MGNLISAESPIDAEMTVKVTKKDGTVEQVKADVPAEDLKSLFAIIRFDCSACGTTWLEESAQLEREYMFCPGCGVKDKM